MTLDEVKRKLLLSKGTSIATRGKPPPVYNAATIWRHAKQVMTELRNRIHVAYIVALKKGRLVQSGSNVEDMKRTVLETYWQLFGKV